MAVRICAWLIVSLLFSCACDSSVPSPPQTKPSKAPTHPLTLELRITGITRPGHVVTVTYRLQNVSKTGLLVCKHLGQFHLEEHPSSKASATGILIEGHSLQPVDLRDWLVLLPGEAVEVVEERRVKPGPKVKGKYTLVARYHRRDLSTVEAALKSHVKLLLGPHVKEISVKQIRSKPIVLDAGP